MNESDYAEILLWQARCDEMQVALDGMRDQRDELQKEIAVLRDQVKAMTKKILFWEQTAWEE